MVLGMGADEEPLTEASIGHAGLMNFVVVRVSMNIKIRNPMQLMGERSSLR